jgi:hypothetical protein
LGGLLVTRLPGLVLEQEFERVSVWISMAGQFFCHTAND